MRWLLKSIRDLETITVSGKVNQTQEFTSGDGEEVGEWDSLWIERVTQSTGDRTIDLTQLVIPIPAYYSVAAVVEFSKIRALMIVNNETIPGRVLIIKTTGATDWAQMFGGSTTSQLIVPAGGAVVWNAPDEVSGFGAAVNLKINVPGSNDVTYDLYLGGA